MLSCERCTKKLAVPLWGLCPKCILETTSVVTFILHYMLIAFALPILIFAIPLSLVIGLFYFYGIGH
jgi:hypothetical protein